VFAVTRWLILITPVAVSGISSSYRRPAFISSCCIHPQEQLAYWYSAILRLNRFLLQTKDIPVPPIIFRFCFNYSYIDLASLDVAMTPVILATLKILIWFEINLIYCLVIIPPLCNTSSTHVIAGRKDRLFSQNCTPGFTLHDPQQRTNMPGKQSCPVVGGRLMRVVVTASARCRHLASVADCRPERRRRPGNRCRAKIGRLQRRRPCIPDADCSRLRSRRRQPVRSTWTRPSSSEPLPNQSTTESQLCLRTQNLVFSQKKSATTEWSTNRTKLTTTLDYVHDFSE